MTEKQKRFADEYIISLNATEAYLGVYKNVKRPTTAAAAASRLLTNVKVKKYIEKRLAELEDAAIAKQDEVLKYLTSVLRGESFSEVVVVELEGDGVSSARRIKKAPDERERLKAAELLGKRYALFTDTVDLNASGLVVITDDISTSDDGG
ncbi:MAG TPA: terminase small subunit [Clostridiaceae bacterium]|nr:terminase small subunit [Clostridiaceae bacterium]